MPDPKSQTPADQMHAVQMEMNSQNAARHGLRSAVRPGRPTPAEPVTHAKRAELVRAQIDALLACDGPAAKLRHNAFGLGEILGGPGLVPLAVEIEAAPDGILQTISIDPGRYGHHEPLMAIGVTSCNVAGEVMITACERNGTKMFAYIDAAHFNLGHIVPLGLGVLIPNDPREGVEMTFRSHDPRCRPKLRLSIWCMTAADVRAAESRRAQKAALGPDTKKLCHEIMHDPVLRGTEGPLQAKVRALLDKLAPLL